MDRYFYRAILQLLKPEHIQEVAILDIHGKGNYEKWKLFFESFGLDIYYIGDFDNVFTLDFLRNKLINREIRIKLKAISRTYNGRRDGYLRDYVCRSLKKAEVLSKYQEG